MLRPRSSLFFAYASCALLVLSRELSAQSTTSSTVCKETILGQVRCETETRSRPRTANPWDSLIDAIFPSGEELARRRHEARQEILNSQQQVLLDASSRRERLADEAAARRRDAALRLFSPKVTEVILSFADSIGLRGAAFKEAEGAALKIAEDIFETNPDANQVRIQDDLRPLFSMYSRRKNQFFAVWKSWASSNRITIDSLNKPQRLHLIDAAISAQETYLLKPDENQTESAFSSALLQATEHRRLCNKSRSNSCRVLQVKTDRFGETITLNGAAVGRSPTSFTVDASEKNTITIGDGEWLHSESLAPPAKIWTALGVSTSIKLGVPAIETNRLRDHLIDSVMTIRRVTANTRTITRTITVIK